MENEKEIWKDIPEYEGKYQASNLGRIRSLKRQVPGRCHYTNKTFYRTIPGKILKPGRYSKSGHLSVVLGHGTPGKPVHQLIMRAFVGSPPENMEVLHVNGDPTDNRLSNLRYGTRTENILDVYYQGNAWRKLDIESVEQIRFGLCCGISGSELSRMYNVSATTISSIKQERSFAWL